MNKQNTKYLYGKYPEIFRDHSKSMRKTCMCWGFECGNGWFNLINKLCSDLTLLMDKYKIKIIADQVKEKFGGLRFYIHIDGDTHQSVYNKVDELIKEAEEKSFKICEICGEKGKQRGKQWVRTLCDKCNKPKIEEE